LLDNKLAAAHSFGATHTINAAQSKTPESTVRELTAGRGADYVFVTVGSQAAIGQGLKMMRRGGTLIVVGMPPSGTMVSFEGVDLAYNEYRIIGSNMGSTRLQVDVPYLVALYQNGRLKLDELITARYPLEKINEAITAVKRGEALRNVIVF
jgi:Zn-dependent alcohol dehydrogenase